MKKELSKSEIQNEIENLFKKNNFSPNDIKKIKKLAMTKRIRLGVYRRNFCKNCLNPLKGKIRIKNKHKIIECKNCSYKNKIRL